MDAPLLPGLRLARLNGCFAVVKKTRGRWIGDEVRARPNQHIRNWERSIALPRMCCNPRNGVLRGRTSLARNHADCFVIVSLPAPPHDVGAMNRDFSRCAPRGHPAGRLNACKGPPCVTVVVASIPL